MTTDEAGMIPENRADDRRHKFWRFSPEINTGHILTVATLCIGAITAYGTYQADKTQTKADLDAVKVTAVRDRDEMKNAVEALRVDIKELKTDVRTVGENVTVLKATQQQKANGK